MIAQLWERLHAPTDRARSLAVFRVFIAVHLLKKLFFQWPSLDTLYGPGTFVELGEPTLKMLVDVGWLQDHHRAIALLYVACLVMFALGIGKHLTALAVFVLLEIFQRLNGYILNGGDNLLKFCVLYMVLADSYQHLCLTKLRMRPGWRLRSSNLMTNLAVCSVMMHVALVYLVAGLHKAHSNEWFSGIATYYTLSLDRFKATALNDWIAQNMALVTASTYATMLWELGFVFLVWNRKLRPWVLLLGVSLHLGIYVLMMIHDFQTVFVATYVLFVDDAQLLRVTARTHRAFARLCPEWLATRVRVPAASWLGGGGVQR